MINLFEHYIVLAILITGFSFGGRFRYRTPKVSLAINIAIGVGLAVSGNKNLIYAGLISIGLGGVLCLVLSHLQN